MNRAWPAYALALAFGVGLGVALLPSWAIVGALPPGGGMPQADFAQHVTGQRYFLGENWTWPLLDDRALDAENGGTSIAMTDSIPLWTLLSRLVHPRVPQTITIFLFVDYVLQPVAAVFALRGTGERRLLPALAVAVIAASMPSFLARAGHVALSCHAGLLAALGLYLRLCRRERAPLVLASALLPALLLIHPYLMLMAAALLLAAPLTLALRRDRFALRAAIAVGVALGLTEALGALLGYWGTDDPGGFGFYSMNLASPFWPANSGLLAPFVFLRPLDATGGQVFEGYQYLGAGVLLLIVAAVVLEPRAVGRALARHGGLAAAALALLLLALSDRVFLFDHLVVRLPIGGHVAAQARSSGRLFWPVAYVLTFGAAASVARRRRGGVALVLVAAALQWIDAGPLRDEPRATLAPAPFHLDAGRLSALMRPRRSLTVLPLFPCTRGDVGLLMEPIWLAGATLMRTNTMYVARRTHAQSCVPADLGRHAIAIDELVVITPGDLGLGRLLRGGEDDCRVLSGMWGVCTHGAAGLDGLPPLPPPPAVPAGAWQATGIGGPGAVALLAFSPAEPWGAWSDGPIAALSFRPPVPGRATRLTLRVAAMPPPGGTVQHVTASVAGRALAVLSIGAATVEPSVVLPPGADAVVFAIDHPVRVPHLADPRRFGIKLFAFRLDPVAGADGQPTGTTTSAGHTSGAARAGAPSPASARARRSASSM